MQKKIFVDGMFDDDVAGKVAAAVKAVAGVTNCEANPMKAQVLVDFEGADEGAIDAAISSAGVTVLG
ncbi:MAG: cation transporter [Treponema sp.]|nr:cation transporter [Treponema sp.]